MKKNIKLFFFNLITVVCFFLFLEGFISTVVVLREVLRTDKQTAERNYTKYDELLGWISKPNVFVKDLYGKGLYVRTNSQGFRSDKDYSLNIPKGKIRILCCGDSFTFGHGVDNEHAWTKLLSMLDKRVEVINMGQAGYGLDQAYLWYMRDGKKFEHNIQIFAFTTEDFDRLRDHIRSGYYKPVLRVVDSSIRVINYPVTNTPNMVRTFKEHLSKFSQFRIYSFYERLSGFLSNSLNKRGSASSSSFNDETKSIAIKVFTDLQKINNLKGSKLVLVYLPSDEDYFDYQPDTNLWRKWVAENTAKKNILYFDLYNEFLKLPVSEVKSLFLLRDVHYSNQGNKFIAQVLYSRLFPLFKNAN